LPLWEILTPLHPLQFPWRFLQLVAFGTSLLCGFPFLLLRGRPVAANALLAVSVGVLVAFGLPHAAPENFVTRAEADFTPANIAAQGIPATAREFEPIWVERFPATPSTRELSLISGRGSVLASHIRPFDRRYVIDVAEAGTAEVALFDFPGWRLTVDGRPRAIRHDNPSGLVQFALEPGPHVVELHFGSTAARTWSTLTSLAVALAFAGTFAARAWRRRRTAPGS
jgi:hypothetical protein